MDYIDSLPRMDLMRSEKMVLVQLIIPVESAHRAISYLGELGLLQFRDVCSDLSVFSYMFVWVRNTVTMHAWIYFNGWFFWTNSDFGGGSA